MAVRGAMGRMESVWRCPSSLPVFSIISCFVTRVSLLFIRAMIGFGADVVSDVDAIHKRYIVLLGAVASGPADCTFVRSDTQLNFSWNLVSSGPKLVSGRSKCGDCLPVTTARTPNFSKNRCPRGLSKILSTTRAVFFQAPRAHAVLH